MTLESSRPISPEEAATQHGMTSVHEQMPNGELRFRLRAADGSAYIRTAASAQGGWQASHSHQRLIETYIVQSEWMAIAVRKGAAVSIQKIEAGNSISTEPSVPHNIYLPTGAVIHTVKHGADTQADWIACPELDQFTQPLNEDHLLAFSRMQRTPQGLDERHGSYVDIYNNLDNLIWQVPGFFIGGAGLFFGFAANGFQKDSAQLPPAMWAGLFIFVSLLFWIGAYSMWRLRIHHSRMGDEIMKMEPHGYFRSRSASVKKKWPPSAPSVFTYFFSLLGGLCFAAAVLVLTHREWFQSMAH